MIPNPSTRPRILFVTPEVAFMPARTGNRTYYMGVHSGCSGDFPAELINDLLNLGVDVHVAQPDYRKIFEMLSRNEPANPSIKLPSDRVHLAEDRAFFYSKPIKSNYEWENIEISLDFQREVINQIAPRVQPDLIHCHDWMTGLIPAAAKEYELPCLFTVQNADSAKCLLTDVEDKGIDAAAFWRRLFYDRFPGDYKNTRDTNPLDLLLSGILAARYVETANFVLLPNAACGDSQASYTCLRQVLAEKSNAGCAFTIAAAYDPSTNIVGNTARHGYQGPYGPNTGKPKSDPSTARVVQSIDHCKTAYRYLDLYERILQRSLIARTEKPAEAETRVDPTRASNSQAISHRRLLSDNSAVFYRQPNSIPAMAGV